MRIGIIGLGRIGLMHARNLAQTEGVDEVVLCGRNPERVAAAAVELERALAPGAPAGLAGELAPDSAPARIVVGGGFGEELPSLDGAVIATSTATHPELSLQAARAGVPVLVEKPLALDREELSALADELEATGTEVMVAFHRRYDPAHRELRRRVQAGEAGTVRAVTAHGHDRTRLTPEYIPTSGGIWLDMLIHDFDSVPWVVGERVKSVWATGSVLDYEAHAEHDDVDSAVAVLVFESGVTATVSGLRRNEAGQDVRLEVFGSENTFGVGIEPRTPIVSTEPGVPAPERTYTEFIDRFERAFRAEVAAFVDLIRGSGENLTPPRAGLAAIEIALAADESLRTGRRVDLV
ncbi:Gfo/Idh/MocA family oxidoreductase [Gulosibacter sp. 10]|uniref:Gfo/Idh/MocA family protein n=1 Tax=Gulosibacter sp. 10 TaxID=1255570 RepID=UPI00097F20FC|nr:Gfo/Idh/MocA family oxidoreductase [Gulosibacter sp. 10]SJM71297.1 Myo-inositol 2-dehydrogenase [Gulosibacter sp. 10]